MSDYIKREDVINTVQKANYIGDNESLRLAFEIDDILSADVVPKDFHDKTCEAMAKRHTEEIQRLMPKRGKWIDKGDRYWYCSECDTKDTDTWDWCHGCGADMREVRDERV